ncbi:MAG: polymer-forming cytoskeletal protein [Butyrivibrio sp.]|nr:polymer-forming cytoskeletal protein [Butyrivibrio sp.]
MFGKKTDVTFDASLEQVGTIIGPGAFLDGPLTTKDSTRIDGTVKGNVTISGALIVGQEGRVIGTVSALNVYAAGSIEGNVAVPQGKVEISDTGRIIGDITCKGIIIDENAVFQGKCEMTGLDKNSAEVAKERAAADKAAEEKKAEEEKSEEKKDDKSKKDEKKN